VSVEKFKETILLELGEQRRNAILIIPVFVAMGIGFYFSFLYEPFWWWGGLALVLTVVALFLTRGFGRLIVLSLLCVALGFTAAQIRTHFAYTPMIVEKQDFKDISGRIVAIEELEKGVRLTLSDVQIENIEPNMIPRKVRLKLWEGDGYEIGQNIEGLASLMPPSPPVIPRGFDFQKYMYFRGIGAVGFFYKPPEIISEAQRGNWIEGLRSQIGERIEGALNQPQSGLARALMVGQRSSIGEMDMEAIRAAGLAHMLAISGLHVGLFSGVVFFFLRFGMAFFPSFALRHPIKKYAAVAAMGAAFFYMLIAGATIPTQRAMITVAVMFTAILLDRSPISLRVVAFAAFCVLLVFPESLTSASFQMSFAAVTGLVAFYDWTRSLWSKWARQAGWVRKAALYFGGVAMTTIVATLVTAPLTLYHFQALPSYGLIANVMCVPLLAFVVMPLAIVGFLLMPFGLEGYVFLLMRSALSAILEFAHFVSELDGAVLHISSFSLSALVFTILAVLSVVIFRARLGIILGMTFGVCALFNFKWIQYDVLISSKMDLVALNTGEPYLLVSDKRKSAFQRENWEQAMGLEGGNAVRFPREGALSGEGYALSCDENACRYEVKGSKVSYLKAFDHSVFQDECMWADVVISKDIYEGRDCTVQHIINRRSGKYYGVHGGVLGDNVRLDRVEDFRGNRPWVQAPRNN
jgi:competence protein ComEC